SLSALLPAPGRTLWPAVYSVSVGCCSGGLRISGCGSVRGLHAHQAPAGMALAPQFPLLLRGAAHPVDTAARSGDPDTPLWYRRLQAIDWFSALWIQAGEGNDPRRARTPWGILPCATRLGGTLASRPGPCSAPRGPRTQTVRPR